MIGEVSRLSSGKKLVITASLSLEMPASFNFFAMNWLGQMNLSTY